MMFLGQYAANLASTFLAVVFVFLTRHCALFASSFSREVRRPHPHANVAAVMIGRSVRTSCSEPSLVACRLDDEEALLA
jgi:hypothetical protein